MKKTQSLVVALLLFTSLCYSQGFVTLSVGSSIPTGDFASTDVNSTSAGFAKTGPAFDLSIGKVIWKKLGLSGTVRYQMNDYDTDAMKKAFNSSPSIVADKWTSFMILVGPYLEFSLGSNYKLDVKLQSGYFSAPFPEVDVTSGTTSVIVTGNTGSSTAVLGGINLRRNLGDKFAVALTVDYTTATVSYKVKTDYYTSMQLTNSTNDKLDQTISNVNTMIGISYRFGN